MSRCVVCTIVLSPGRAASSDQTPDQLPRPAVMPGQGPLGLLSNCIIALLMADNHQ